MYIAKVILQELERKIYNNLLIYFFNVIIRLSESKIIYKKTLIENNN